MNTTRKITEIEKILISRDGYTPEQAYDYLEELREMVANGENPEEVLEYELGLEPDYIFDLL